ncbi:MAG TPA: hypothetical protein P5559_09135, partial [Candidatus Limiplasma sp.]|nr:hypothetical protein [Candidatus Limiplasma sp.]
MDQQRPVNYASAEFNAFLKRSRKKIIGVFVLIILLLIHLFRRYSLVRADMEMCFKIDPLTGLYNRKTFNEMLDLEIAR